MVNIFSTNNILTKCVALYGRYQTQYRLFCEILIKYYILTYLVRRYSLCVRLGALQKEDNIFLQPARSFAFSLQLVTPSIRRDSST